MGNMGSAHPLVEVNVSFKFERNPSISKGVIERTRIGDGRTDGPTDRPTDRPTDGTKRIQYSPPHILWWGYNYICIIILCKEFRSTKLVSDLSLASLTIQTDRLFSSRSFWFFLWCFKCGFFWILLIPLFNHSFCYSLHRSTSFTTTVQQPIIYGTRFRVFTNW